MSGNTKTVEDVVTFLTDQHQAIKDLFIEVLDAPDAIAQEHAFARLRMLLAVHETAEEMIVHPRARRKAAAGAIVDELLAEEHASKVALADLERLTCGTAEFSKSLIHLQRAVLAHAEHEEAEEFPLLTEELTADELAKLTSAVKLVESFAPTHPHPGVESALANFAFGPFAAVLDRARDALRG